MTTDFPTASVGSSQAPTAAVEKSQSASNTEIQTLPSAHDAKESDMNATSLAIPVQPDAGAIIGVDLAKVTFSQP